MIERMNWLIGSLALVTLTASAQAGSVGQRPGLNIVGLLPDQPTEAQQGFAFMGMLLMRNILTGSESLEPDPWPCREGSSYGVLGFLPNSRQAYEKMRSGLLKQGFTLKRELWQDDTTVVLAFQRGPLTLTGIWGKAPSGPRSTLLLCEWSGPRLK